MATRGRGRGLLVLAMLVMAGCCSQDSPLLVQQREKQRSAVAAQQAAEASQSGLLRFRTQAQDGVLLRSELLQAECIDGVGGNGMARIDWEVSLPGVDRVRVSVVDGDQAKIWSEAGTVSGETTGAWLKQGLGFRFEATNDGRLLGQIDVIAQPCAGAP